MKAAIAVRGVDDRFLDAHLNRTTRDMPGFITGEAEMQTRYRACHQKVQSGQAIAALSTCRLPEGDPDQACAALALGTAFIEARKWQRDLDILKTAQAQALNLQAIQN